MKHKLLHSRLSLLAAALTGAVAPAQAADKESNISPDLAREIAVNTLEAEASRGGLLGCWSAAPGGDCVQLREGKNDMERTLGSPTLLAQPKDFSLVLGGPAAQQAGAEGSIGADTGRGEDIVPSVASSMLGGFMARAWQIDSTRLRCNPGLWCIPRHSITPVGHNSPAWDKLSTSHCAASPRADLSLSCWDGRHLAVLRERSALSSCPSRSLLATL